MASVHIKKKAHKLIKSWLKLTGDYDKAVHCALWEAEYNMHLNPCKLKSISVVKYIRDHCLTKLN